MRPAALGNGELRGAAAVPRGGRGDEPCRRVDAPPREGLCGDPAGGAVTTTPANKRRMSGRALKGGGGGGGEADPDDPEGGFDTETLCAADPSICLEDGTSCFYFSNNPDGGTISFDTVPMSFIAILQAVTFDTWTDPMFDIMDSYSYSAWIYFILVAILGGLFVVNLFLAVIFDEFIRAQEMTRRRRS